MEVSFKVFVKPLACLVFTSFKFFHSLILYIIKYLLLTIYLFFLWTFLIVFFLCAVPAVLLPLPFFLALLHFQGFPYTCILAAAIAAV